MSNSNPFPWPVELVDFLQHTYGPLPAVDQLGGIARTRNWRVVFDSVSVIVKISDRPNEQLFYQTVAPALVTQGVPIPQLEWAAEVDGRSWIVLEYIPHPVPQERRDADPEMLMILRRLHESVLVEVPGILFHTEWNSAMSTDALASLPTRSTMLEQIIQELQEASQVLFAPRCFISGDPNLTNWGMRNDQSLVLFDWERFGKGSRALDLAITIPGLGEQEHFQRVAQRYLQAAQTDIDTDLYTLTREIVLAKAWNIVEFLSIMHIEQRALPEPIQQLVQRLPEWFISTHRFVKTGSWNKQCKF